MSGPDRPDDGEPEATEPPPDPIHAQAELFDLGANPEALQGAAGAIRALGLRASAAGETVTTAADAIDSEGAWLGETADKYQHHRRSLTGDLGALGSSAANAADALDEIANLLIFYQAALDEARAAIVDVPVTTSERAEPDGTTVPSATYHPRTEDEATAVSDALARAADLRTSLAETMVLQESSMRRLVDGYDMPWLFPDISGLRMVAETWRPQNLRHLNLNIGEGDPTDVHDMDEIAGIINRDGADVVTIQEVFRQDIDNITQHLDGEWAVYFGTADTKFRDPRKHGGLNPFNFSEDFGNAVLVRQSDTISSRAVEADNRIKLDPAGSVYPYGPDDPRIAAAEEMFVDPDDMVTETVSADEIPDDHHADGEGRAAAVAEITVNL